MLLAAVQASREERRYETAILRVLGAGRGMLLRSALAEFTALGLLAGILAASGAVLGGWLLARQLDLHYRYDATAWVAGVLATTLIVALSGVLAMRPALSQPPRSILN